MVSVHSSTIQDPPIWILWKKSVHTTLVLYSPVKIWRGSSKRVLGRIFFERCFCYIVQWKGSLRTHIAFVLHGKRHRNNVTLLLLFVNTFQDYLYNLQKTSSWCKDIGICHDIIDTNLIIWSCLTTLRSVIPDDERQQPPPAQRHKIHMESQRRPLVDWLVDCKKLARRSLGRWGCWRLAC